jgi:hypothetical protein
VPTQEYRNTRGERLPGTTWVIGQNLGWNKDALMRWANREGLAGRNIRDERGTTAQRAADIGTAAHAMIEAHILGQEPEAVAAPFLSTLNADDRPKAWRGFTAFQRWFRNSRLVIVGTELYGVDEEYQTGYCLDALALDQDVETRLEVCDWKSSKGTYADHFIQVSAYTVFTERRLSAAWEQKVEIAGAHVVRVDKSSGAFKHIYWPRDILEDGWRVFTWLRALHQLKFKIEAHTR